MRKANSLVGVFVLVNSMTLAIAMSSSHLSLLIIADQLFCIQWNFIKGLADGP